MESSFIGWTTLNPTHLFAMIFCWGIALTVLWEHRLNAAYVHSAFLSLNPAQIARFPAQNISPIQFHLLGLLALVALISAGAFVFPRVALLLSAGILYIYYKVVKPVDGVRRKPLHIMLILMSLAFLPDWEFSQYGTSFNDVQTLVLLILSQMYVSSAFHKLKKSDWKWGDGNSLKYYLNFHFLMYDDQLPLWLAQQPKWVLKVASISTLIFEGTFFLLLFFPALIPVYIAIGIGFHLFSLIIMRINYLRLVIWSYLGLLAVYYM